MASKLREAATAEKSSAGGNGVKMREALIDVVKRLEARVGCDHHTFHPTATTCDGHTSVGKCGNIATCAAIFKARAVLAAPPRNCDVGTVEEQAKRMDKFCDSHRHGFDGRSRYACENCKFISVDRCELAWAQMPYKGKNEK